MTTTLRTLDPGTLDPKTPGPAPHHAATPSTSGAEPAAGTTRRSGIAPLDMRHVTVRHPDGVDAGGTPRFHTALDDATLTLDAGTFTLLLGPSGSGKSTLLSSAAGLIVPDSGSVTIAGQDLGVLDDDDRSRIRRTLMGIVFQQPNLFASLTVMEQLLLPGTLERSTRRHRAEQIARARDLLHRVGLDGLEQRRPHQLSGGQRQRVAIARALMGTPRLLLVDEPTSALDQEAGHRIVDLLTGITHDLGTATLMVTHDQTLAPRADRVVTITDGRLGGVGPDRANGL